MEVNRRRFLGGVVAAAGSPLAGCLGDSDDTEDEEDWGEVFRDISVEMREPTIEYIVVSGEVLNGFAERAPAAIRVEFRNTSDQEREIFGAYRAGLRISDFYAQRDDGTNHLLAVPRRYKDDIPIIRSMYETFDWPDESEDECWRLPGRTHIDPGNHSRGSEPFSLAAGEGITEEFEFWVPYQDSTETDGAGPCPPPGRYPFWTRLSVEGSALIWGFDLHVSG